MLVFLGYRTIIARYVAKWVSHRCACVKLSTQGGIAPFWGVLTSLKKVSRGMGYRSDSIAMSRDMGPLSSAEPQDLGPEKAFPRIRLPNF